MSLKSGQYPQPLVRPAFIEAPVVPGYATVRLFADLQFSGTGTSPVLADNLVLATVENTGDMTAAVQLREVGDYSSGLPYRSNITNVLTLVPGGRTTTTFTPQQQYVELWGVSGTSDIRMQLNTQVPWTLMAFAKSDTTYPPQLWQPPSYNPPSS